MFRIPYLRNYPWPLQLFLFIMTAFIIASLFDSALLPLLLPKLTGYSFTQAVAVNESSSYNQVKAALLAQAIVHASIFLIPSLLFAYLTHPKPKVYLGLRKPGKSIQWLLVILLTLGAMPLIIGTMSLFQSMHWGKWADDAQKQIDAIEKAFFNMPSPLAFINVFFVMAILPAFGEEFLFRGIIMRFIKKRSIGMAFPIGITALMFALVHFSVYGFVPIFISGVLLGLVYYLTGSLWCSILFHLLNNGLQIVAVYVGKTNPTVDKIIEGNTVPAYLLIGGLFLFIGSFYLLWKNRTPLPADWAIDFTKEELAEQQENKTGIF